MRIGIDARELCGRATGAGRYLHGLLRQWNIDDSARSHEFVLYAPEPLAVSFDARRFPTRIVAGTPNTWWEQVRLPPIAARDPAIVTVGASVGLAVAAPDEVVHLADRALYEAKRTTG